MKKLITKLKVSSYLIMSFMPFLLKSQTISLPTLLADTVAPAGATLEYHNQLPLSGSNIVANPSAVDTGIYYIVYNFGGTCYSIPTPIRIAAPTCPDTTVNLGLFVDSTKVPAGMILSFHSSLPVSLANKLNTTIKPAGKYYVAFYDTSKGCFSDPNLIVVKSNNCLGICLQLKVYLQSSLENNGGANAAGVPLMRDDLRNSPFTHANYIPLNDPYTYPTLYTDFTSSFNKVGAGLLSQNLTILDSNTVFSVTGKDAIIDWVFVELRSKSNKTFVAATRAGLLQRDGDVVDIDGTSCLNFQGLAIDSYYVAIRHRNHLGAMSKYAQSPAQLQAVVDFTTPTLPLFNFGTSLVAGLDYTGLSTNDNIITGYRALWAGNFDANKKVKFDSPDDDLNTLLFEVYGYATNANSETNYDFAFGYFQGDFDMNSKAKFENPDDDKNLLYFQVMGYPLNLLPETNFDLFLEQIPY